MRYRPDIDGLRALAVVPVVLFHLGTPYFTGGFVGVDVFFVISGFLITSLIVDEMQRGQFSFANFYERRARRILPALFLVMAASFIAAYFLFLPEPMEAFARSLVPTSLFSSNFFFWWQVGYFDAPAELKPLLHTWSLAVEEQFYLLYPPLLYFAVQRWKRAWPFFFAALLVASFMLSGWAGKKAPSADFYLLPFRAWELLLGTLLAADLLPRSENRIVAAIASVAGVALIGYSVVMFDETTRFPGRLAAIPCLGAALLIYAGSVSNETPVGRLLTLRPVVLLGLISYSLYLWHWPLIVFGTYWNVMPPSAPMCIVMFVASVALAAASWRWLEVPIRKKVRLPTRHEIFAGVGACATVFFLLGLWGTIAKGWPGRVDPALAAIADSAQYMHDRRDCDGALKKQLDELCVRGASGIAPDFALVGDSHADALSPGLFAGAKAANRAGYQFTDGGYRPAFGFIRPGDKEGRVKRLDKILLHFLDSRQPRDVFIMTQWTAALRNEYTDESGTAVPASEVLTKSIGWLARAYPRTHFYIIEDNPVAPELSPILAAQAIQFGKQRWVGITRRAYEEQRDLFRPVLSELTKLPNIQRLSFADLLCDDAFCPSTIQDKPLYRDTNHLSPTGATRLAEFFRQCLSPTMATAAQR